MILGITKEPQFDNRVSILPELIDQIKKLNLQVIVEKGAGERAYASDEMYSSAGAELFSREEILKKSDIILQINPPSDDEIDNLKEGQTLISFLQPLVQPNITDKLAAKKVTGLSFEMIPRSSRAQTMDVLSSQATIAGYKAVLLASSHLPKFFPMLTTAAGSIPPAKVLIIGAGVAGLMAIATARRLGGVVEAFDTRPAVKEEVKSLGAKFVEVEGAADASKAGGYAVEQTEKYKKKQSELIQIHALASDVIVTTAQIPGRKAPLLITTETLNNMKKGSVIVDLASSSGGNCEMTKDNATVDYNGITIIGNSNLPSTMPYDASKMFGKNALSLLKILIKEGNININFDDDIIKGMCVTHNGENFLKK
ncbi:MAG: Re/Si-specific NAD(P)(+) transhydrogenase subunit alpha [Ignavibacteria bacterium]|nr:Re/Si-specific NAD(P)(+) transhydrogenase subunit alpha [Ignavibacteria bacterium]